MRERTVVVNGFSKAYAMTGWRLGFATGPKEIIAAMTKVHQYGIMCAPTTSQYAAISALRNGDDDIERMREEYNMRRRMLVDGLNNIGLECFEPEGAFYVFPDITAFGLSSLEFAQRLLEEKHVAVVPGIAFGDDRCIRLSYACSMENIEEGLQRLAEFCATL
jgi:aminotransferase